MARATAICEVDDKVVVICPHCTAIHAHDKATTGRLIEIPAACDETLRYVIPETMKVRTLNSALNVYRYEAERKRQQYIRKKSKQPKEADCAEEGVPVGDKN